jgi:hypothetical protein
MSHDHWHGGLSQNGEKPGLSPHHEVEPSSPLIGIEGAAEALAAQAVPVTASPFVWREPRRSSRGAGFTAGTTFVGI